MAFDPENTMDRKDIRGCLLQEMRMKDITHSKRAWNKWQ
jgi:hypothetical protein